MNNYLQDINKYGNEKMFFMKGGKLLNKGAYGCVFQPGIKKSGKKMKDKKTVSKLSIYDRFALNEMEISTIITQYFKSNLLQNKLFGIMTGFNFVNVKKIEDEDIKKCTFVYENFNKRFIVLNMDFIDGITLEKYILKYRNRSSKLVNKLLNSYLIILKGLSTLSDLNIVHYDLKSNNIMFDNVSKIPKIIDFGISINMTQFMDKKNNFIVDTDLLRKRFYTFAPSYSIWSLEIHYLCYIIHINIMPDKNDLKTIINKFISDPETPLYYIFSHTYSPGFIKKYKQLCLKQLEYYNTLTFENKVKKILSSWNTWDNYSLSLMYLGFLNVFNSDGYDNNPITIFLSKILIQNLHPDPKKRYDIYDTIQKYNKIMLNNDKIVSNFENFKLKIANNKYGINDLQKINKTLALTKKGMNSK